MQLSVGIIVAIIALAAAAGAAYYVQTQHGSQASTTIQQQPTQTPGTSIPVTTTTQSSTPSPSTPSQTTMSTTTSAQTGTSATSSTTTPTTTYEETTTMPSTTPTMTTTTTSQQTSTTSTSSTTITTTSPRTTTTTTSPATSPTETTTTTQPSTSTTTTTVTTTTTTTTTTTQQTTTTTTQTQTSTTTTTTTPKEETIKPAAFSTYRDVLGNFSKATIYYKAVNQSDVNEGTISFKTSKTADGYKVEISIVALENGEVSSNQTITMYTDNTFSTITKVVMPDGQVLEGQMAQMVGQQILQVVNSLVAMVAWVGNIEIGIAEGSYTAMKAGWEVTGVSKTSVTISDNTYNAYKISVVNKNDEESSTKSVDFTVAEIKPDIWIIYKVYAVQKDGAEFTWKLVELVPSQ